MTQRTAWGGELPPVLGYQELAILLHRSVGSLQADLCRKPDSLPPHVRVQGTRQPLWLLSTVLTWLSDREDRPEDAPRRRPGRPKKTPSGAL